MELTKVLTNIYEETRFDRLDAATVDRCADLVLDHVATVVAAVPFPEAAAIRRFCGPYVTPTSTALVLGTLAEILEAQDGYRSSGVHPASSVLPAALAAAAQMRAPGSRLVEAIVVGYEVICRLGNATHPGQSQRGTIPTGLAGAFGAAAAVCKLAGEPVDALLSCLGICSFMAPLSTTENVRGGYSIKPTHGGLAARTGLESWEMLRAGFAGNPNCLEGPRGYLEIVSPELHMDLALDPPGPKPIVNACYFKPYPSCRHTHGAIGIVRQMMAKGLRRERVKSINVYIYKHATIMVGRVPEPGSGYMQCQFSVPFTLASMLIDGKYTPAALTPEVRERPEVRGLAERVRVFEDPEYTKVYPYQVPTRVEVEEVDGNRWEAKVTVPPGDFDDPMTRPDLLEKFQAFTTRLPAAQANALAKRCLSLGSESDTSVLLAEILAAL